MRSCVFCGFALCAKLCVACGWNKWVLLPQSQSCVSVWSLLHKMSLFPPHTDYTRSFRCHECCERPIHPLYTMADATPPDAAPAPAPEAPVEAAPADAAVAAPAEGGKPKSKKSKKAKKPKGEGELTPKELRKLKKQQEVRSAPDGTLAELALPRQGSKLVTRPSCHRLKPLPRPRLLLWGTSVEMCL